MQKKNDKMTNSGLQNTMQKTRETRTTLKAEKGNFRCSGMVSSFCSTSGTRRVTLATNPVIRQE